MGFVFHIQSKIAIEALKGMPEIQQSALPLPSGVGSIELTQGNSQPLGTKLMACKRGCHCNKMITMMNSL